MPKVLVIHHDDAVRSRLQDMMKRRHDVTSIKELVAGAKEIARSRPDVIVVGQDLQREEGTRLLKYLRDNQLKLPVVVIAMRGAGSHQPIAMKLGARAFIEFPVDEVRLEETIAEAQRAQVAALASPPPITSEEQAGNLSTLERQLNARMKCFAGRNQVYIQSRILGGATSKPRICLKCSLRGENGLSKDVYYEFIRDVCCVNPTKCEAMREFQAERESA